MKFYENKNFGVIAIVAIAVAVAFNVSLSKQTHHQASQLVLANVEALADEEDEEYLEDDIFNLDGTGYPTFIKDAIPGYETLEFHGKTDAHGYITFSGKKFGPFGAGVDVSFTYRSGICPKYSGAVCKYSHIGSISLL